MTRRTRYLPAQLLLAVAAAACLDWDKLEAGRCGDGFVGPEETCDDGNRRKGDGCDADCRPEPPACVDMCDAGAPTLPVCGNSKMEAGEECDDGSARAGDGCDQFCKREPERPLCGNGTLDDDEVCDDANQSNTDGCLNGCSRASCGDGQVRTHVEECEVVSGDDVATCNGCLLCPAEPDGYFNPRTEHCYTRHSERLNQIAARRMCQAEGGDLWTVTSIEEGAATIERLMLSGTYWLGRLRTAGVESWVTGEPAKFSNYAEGEPRLPNGPCIGLNADGVDNLWRSETCASELRFVCERSGASISLPSNRAYKVRTADVTRDDARSRCSEQGGKLAAFETSDEQTYVASITNLRVWIDTPTGCVTLEPSGQLLERACSELAAYVCELE